MAFQGLTPESLLDRSDSKNPATTCKGLTTSGRPCRRALGSTPGSSPTNTPTKGQPGMANNDNSAENAGVMAIIDSTNAAAFFCWQHKDQAQNLIAQIETQQRQQQQEQRQQYGDLQRRRTRIIPLQKRSSIDTLIERVGIIDLDGDVNDHEVDPRQGQSAARRSGSIRSESVKVRKRDTLPVEWQGIQGPLMSVPEEVVDEVAPEPRIQRRQLRSRSRNRFDQRESRQERISNANGRSKPKSSWSCCGLADDGYNDDGPPVRRRERYEQRRPYRSRSRPRPSASVARPTSYDTGVTSRPVPQAHSRPPVQMQERPQHQPQNYNTRPISVQQQQWQQQPNRPPQSQSTPTRQRPPPNPVPIQNSMTSTSTPPHSQTTHFLSLIPPHLNPNTTSALLSELSKPFAKDDDAGYIYIYWLTPSSTQTNPNNEEEDKPDDDIASTILDSDSDSDSDLASEDSYRPSHARHRSKPGQPRPHSHAQSTRRKAALTRYASTKGSNPISQLNGLTTTTTTTAARPTPPKILLKIGRATNVHRRMTQWSKQCGQNITLVRYYPYQPSSSSSAPHTHTQPAAGKVPHVNRVERLIHLELRGMGVGYGAGEKCGVCGRGHREWFEVEGSRSGLKMVDGVVRRWVGWGLQEGGGGMDGVVDR